MTAYIKDRSSGRGDDLTQSLAIAGALPAQINLFKFLTTASFCVTEAKNTFAICDTRAAASLLFLLPMPLRVLVTLALYQEELELYKGLVLPEYSTSEYNLQVQIVKPLTILDLSAALEGHYLDAVHLVNILDELTYTNEELHLDKHWQTRLLFILGSKLSPPFLIKSANLSERLTNLFNKTNYTGLVRCEDFISIATTNDRIKTTAYLCNFFGYGRQNTQIILGIIELWLNKHSYI